MDRLSISRHTFRIEPRHRELSQQDRTAVGSGDFELLGRWTSPRAVCSCGEERLTHLVVMAHRRWWAPLEPLRHRADPVMAAALGQ